MPIQIENGYQVVGVIGCAVAAFAAGGEASYYGINGAGVRTARLLDKGASIKAEAFNAVSLLPKERDYCGTNELVDRETA